MNHIDEFKASQPIKLVKELKDSIADLKKMPMGLGQMHHQLLILSSSGAGTPTTTAAQRMVPLDPADFPTILIEFNALRDACAYGRDSDSPMRLNAIIGAIIDFFIRPSEWFKYTLTGRTCRSIHNSEPTILFPSDTLSAMTNFTLNHWGIWHKKRMTEKLITAAQLLKDWLAVTQTTCTERRVLLHPKDKAARFRLGVPANASTKSDNDFPPPNDNNIERVISSSSAD